MKKQIITLILMVSIIITIVPFSVSAATSGVCGENLTWTLDDNGTLTISGEGEMSGTSRIEDSHYIIDTPWLDENNLIKSVIIEEGITKIGDCAFGGCENLTSVNIPNGVVELGHGSFGCTKLSKVIIPDTVKKIDGACFASCANLNEIYIGKNVEYIGDNAFSGTTTLTSIVIPESVTYIGEGAFSRSNIKMIYYEGSKEQWDNIEKKYGWNGDRSGFEEYIIKEIEINYKENEKVTDYTSYDLNPINVIIDGVYIYFDVQPQIINGRTMVPMRTIFEELGATVNWDDTTQTAIGTKGNTVVKFTVNDYTMYKNESANTFDVPAQLINGRTLIPLRAVSEAFDCQVGWDGTTNIVSIVKDSENYTLLYAPNKSAVFKKSDVAAQLTVGWSEDPFITMYSLDGKTNVVNKTDIESWKKVGWYETPVCTMYALDGRAVVVPKSDIESWKNVGWYEIDSITTCVPDENGRFKDLDSLLEYLAETETITMYAPDGRSESVRLKYVESWKKVGWYETDSITMYAKNGKSEQVKVTDIEARKKAGWSTEEPEVTLYAHGKSQKFPISVAEAQVAVGWSYTPVGDHKWTKATCTTPKTCTICGETSGNPAEHKWKNATCTTPKTCTVCGQTSGGLAGHYHDTNTGACTGCGQHLLLFNERSIKIYFYGFSRNGSGISINFLIQNNGTREETIQIRDESVNGYMTMFTMSQDVLPGKSAYTDAYLGSWHFGEVGIGSLNDIREVEFKFRLCESDYESKPITIMR